MQNEYFDTSVIQNGLCKDVLRNCCSFQYDLSVRILYKQLFAFFHKRTTGISLSDGVCMHCNDDTAIYNVEDTSMQAIQMSKKCFHSAENI